jgi:RNA polymerase sigma factor (TIGR02999 family)
MGPIDNSAPAPLPLPPAPEPQARPGPVTGLLHRWSAGDREALDRVLPLVYDELRHLARRHLRREREGHTLEGTGLVHEAFLKLAAHSSPVDLPSRAHFLGWASTLMRHILVDHARARQAAKRGGGAAVESLDALMEDTFANAALAAQPGGGDDALDLIAMDRALQRLEALDPQQGRVVELRFFGGLSVEETADALAISPATVKREWATARAWLLRELGHAPPPPPAGVDPGVRTTARRS